MQNIYINICDILTTVELITLLIFIYILLLPPSSIYYVIINEKLCIIKKYLCHDIKEPMSCHHIMELYVTTVVASLLHYTGRTFIFTSEICLHTVASPL